MNHEVIKYHVKWHPKDHLVQPSLAKAWSPQDAQHPAQLNLKSVRYWGIHHRLRKIIPMLDHSHREKFSKCV